MGTSSSSGERLHEYSAGYVAVQESQEFAQLRRRFRGWVFPVTLLFLAWYFLYVLMAVFAPSFMGRTLVGPVNIGLALGLGQFVSTFVITMLYARWADRVFDPAADELATQVLGHPREGASPAESGPAAERPAPRDHEEHSDDRPGKVDPQ